MHHMTIACCDVPTYVLRPLLDQEQQLLMTVKHLC